MNQEIPVRVRFAPSPTGHLHIGSFRTALFNWLFARHNNGAFLVRIEDTDLERSKQEYVDSILSTLQWVGLEVDEPIVTQTKNIQRHKEVIQELLRDGKAYRCYCSPDDLVKRFEKAGNDFFIKYDGYCRNKKQEQSGPFVVRFALPDEITEISFNDIIRGTVSFAKEQLDDFIIARSDGSPMYNFVVVIDDHDMKITHIIRGEDHISNTPKQILLYQACGFDVPQFAHIPLILGPSGDRLSKRDGAVSVLEYRKAGYLSDALLNYLVRLGWSHGDQEIFTRDELVQYFSLDAVGKSGAIFDKEKLDWLNSVYIRQTDNDKLLQYIISDVEPNFEKKLQAWDRTTILHVIELYKERVKTLSELVSELMLLCNGPERYDKVLLAHWVTPEVATHLWALLDILDALDPFDDVSIKNAVKQFANQIDVKLSTLAQPLRIALLGKTSGPGVFQLLGVIGKSQVILRVKKMLETV